MSNDHREYYDEVNRLMAEFHASKGVVLYNHFMSTDAGFYTFQTNFADLNQILRLHNTLRSEHQLGDFNNKKPLERFLYEVTRRLHNFLFSAKCLVDQTRIFVQEQYGVRSKENHEYQHQFRHLLVRSGIDAFTKELRDFFAHVSTPFVYSFQAGTSGREQKRFSLKLDTAEMRRTSLNRGERRKDWTSQAVQYASWRGTDVDLEDYAQEYYDHVIRFYAWLGERNQQWAHPHWKESLRLQHEIEEYRQLFWRERRQH